MSSSGKTGAAERIVGQLKYTREFEDAICSAGKVHVPGGFPFESFTLSDGGVTIVSICRMFNSALYFISNPLPSDPNRSLLNFHLLSADYHAFVGTLKVEVNQRVYGVQVRKYPLTFNCFLRHIGMTSFSKTFTMTNPENSFEYANLSFSSIQVDPMSRAPVPLPKSWRDIYCKFQSDINPLKMERLTRPSNAKSSECRVHFSNIDDQNHTPWHTYVDLCLQTCMEGVFKHWFRRVNEDIAANGVKSYEISFKTESGFDDILKVFVWEDDKSDDFVLFF